MTTSPRSTESETSSPVSTSASTQSPDRSARPSEKPARKANAADADRSASNGAVARDSVGGRDLAVPVIEEISDETSFKRQVVRFVKSWGGSLVFHIAILMSLGLLLLPSQPNEDVERVLNVVERPQDQLTQWLEDEIEPSEDLTFTPYAGVTSESHGDPLTSVAEVQLDQEAIDTITTSEVSLADVQLHAIPASQLTNALGIESPGDPMAAVDGYGGAMDRITQEILLMLAKNKVLIVWLLDESGSMEDDRKAIRSRIDRVYKELGLTTEDESDALLTVISSFGSDFTVHTRRPTSDLVEITEAIDAITEDESGEERTLQAAGEAMRRYRKYGVQGKRQLALIIVTDECGDDGDLVEQTINEARDARCRVYALGREAVFGYPYAHINWKAPKTGYVYQIPIRRGPETAFVEQLQTNGLWRRYDAHPSGFGPYEQVRLCRSTGGIYFVLPSLETNLHRGDRRRYELEAMRPYMPDLDTRDEYLSKRQASEMRTALWEIVATLNPWKEPRVNLLRDFPVEPQAFLAALPAQQRKARDLVVLYDRAIERLDELKRDREHEPSPRWQANYDLLLGQAISYKVRTYEYLAYLDAFVNNPKAKTIPRTTHWRIFTRKKTITDETTKETRDRAIEVFNSLIAEHPGTPYAARAQWELTRGFGIDLREHYHPPDWDDVVRPKF